MHEVSVRSYMVSLQRFSFRVCW